MQSSSDLHHQQNNTSFFWHNRFLPAINQQCQNTEVSLHFNGHFPGGPGLASTKTSPFWILSVMWSETVGLKTRPVWDQKIGLGLVAQLTVKQTVTVVLVLQVLCCVVKHNLVTLVVIMILEETAAFQVLFIVSLFCAWNITTVEINSGVHLLKS